MRFFFSISVLFSPRVKYPTLVQPLQVHIEQYIVRNTPPVAVDAATRQEQKAALRDHASFDMPAFGNGRALRDYQEVRSVAGWREG